MIICRRDIQGKHGAVILEFFKFVVHEDRLHCEPGPSIHCVEEGCQAVSQSVEGHVQSLLDLYFWIPTPKMVLS
jgi:hypothetical protein